jgi:hypothetical protein
VWLDRWQVFSLAYGSVHQELSSSGQPLPRHTPEQDHTEHEVELDAMTKQHIARMNAEEQQSASGTRTKQRAWRHQANGIDTHQEPLPIDDPDRHNVMKRRRPQGQCSVLKLSEEGVVFSSYRDGSRILLTPESSVDCQKKLGADIIIPLDELPPYHTTQEALEQSLARTHRWELRSLQQHLKACHTLTLSLSSCYQPWCSSWPMRHRIPTTKQCTAWCMEDWIKRYGANRSSSLPRMHSMAWRLVVVLVRPNKTLSS